jgi:hypothetical protein
MPVPGDAALASNLQMLSWAALSSTAIPRVPAARR